MDDRPRRRRRRRGQREEVVVPVRRDSSGRFTTAANDRDTQPDLFDERNDDR